MIRKSLVPWLPALMLAAMLPPRAALATWPSNTSINLPVSLAPGSKGAPFVVADGAGGAFVAWRDDRNSGVSALDLYMHHLTAAGTIAPGWPVNGLLVCNAAGNQIPADLISDGAGGAYVLWRDFRAGNGDIYLQRVQGNGTLAPGWPANGLAVSTRADEEGSAHLVSDGVDGLFVVWGLASAGPTNDDLYALRLRANGAPAAGWPAAGKALAATTASEIAPAIDRAADGRLIVAYSSNGLGSYDIRVGFFSAADGSVSLDVPVCTAANTQNIPIVVSNGAGGALVTWSDGRVATAGCYASMVLANGTIPLGWPANGLALLTNSATPTHMVADGHGGAWVLVSADFGAGPTLDVVHATSSGSLNLPLAPGFFGVGGSGDMIADGHGGVIIGSQAQLAIELGVDEHAVRLDADGSVAPDWQDSRSGGPVVVCDAPGDQFGVAMADDGDHGAILIWDDPRAGGGAELYAQRMERFGKPGNPEPVITSVGDVKNDQGGQVRVSWTASYLDVEPTLPVAQYRLWRQVPAAAALLALADGSARLLGASGAADLAPADARDPRAGRALRRTGRDGVLYYWEPAGAVTAAGLAGYSLSAATSGDSTAAGNPYTAFMVDAVANDGTFWSSAPDSGYSVDNLAPATPAPFAGTYVPGSGAILTWGANLEADLAGYRLYRGSSPGFVAGPANLVAALTSPGYFDAGAGPAYYRLSAVDVHGNEGATALLLPSGALAVEDAIPPEVTLGAPEPNPAIARAVSLTFTLPRAMNASLSLYDLQGRRLRTLAGGTLPAGVHARIWDGRDEAGARVRASVCFVRLETPERTLVRRLVWAP